ncbi:hypothetical protein M432DRAFT_628302 [Thermoascus aurantiacus ATCC 26904]
MPYFGSEIAIALFFFPSSMSMLRTWGIRPVIIRLEGPWGQAFRHFICSPSGRFDLVPVFFVVVPGESMQTAVCCTKIPVLGGSVSPK